MPKQLPSKVEIKIDTLENIYKKIMKKLMKIYSQGHISPLALRLLGHYVMPELISTATPRRYQLSVLRRLETLYKKQIEAECEEKISKSKCTYTRFCD